MYIKLKKLKLEKNCRFFITDYINYALAKIEVSNRYIVGGVVFNKQAKKQVFPTQAKTFQTYKQNHRNNKCL